MSTESMKPIKLATGDGFAEIVLNRPEILNAINLEMLTHLSEASTLAGRMRESK